MLLQIRYVYVVISLEVWFWLDILHTSCWHIIVNITFNVMINELVYRCDVIRHTCRYIDIQPNKEINSIEYYHLY